MVSNIWDFDIIVTETEFEALVLENQMIKKYQPKYNILLKDDKGYPFIKVTTSKPYPSFSIVPTLRHDADRYFGPYTKPPCWPITPSTRLNETLKLKTCRRVFPRDIGKDRPCLNLHLGRCHRTVYRAGECRRVRGTRAGGHFACWKATTKPCWADLDSTHGEQAAEDLRFEQARYAARPHPAPCARWAKSRRSSRVPFAELDAVAYAQGQTRGCVVVL